MAPVSNTNAKASKKDFNKKPKAERKVPLAKNKIDKQLGLLDLLANHYPDIVTVVTAAVVFGYMWSTTTDVASMFVTLQHNLTDPNLNVNAAGTSAIKQETFYTLGFSDSLFLIFAVCVTIIVQDILKDLVFEVS